VLERLPAEPIIAAEELAALKVELKVHGIDRAVSEHLRRRSPT